MIDLLILVLGVGAVALWRTTASDRRARSGPGELSDFERHNSYCEGGHHTDFVRVGRKHPEPRVRCSCGAEWVDLRVSRRSSHPR